jgi:hypothetical protein
VARWDDFQDLISAASLHPENQEEVSNFELRVPSRSVRGEEDVTAITLEVLESFGRSAGLLFEADASYISCRFPTSSLVEETMQKLMSIHSDSCPPRHLMKRDLPNSKKTKKLAFELPVSFRNKTGLEVSVPFGRQ